MTTPEGETAARARALFEELRRSPDDPQPTLDSGGIEPAEDQPVESGPRESVESVDSVEPVEPVADDSLEPGAGVSVEPVPGESAGPSDAAAPDASSGPFGVVQSIETLAPTGVKASVMEPDPVFQRPSPMPEAADQNLVSAGPAAPMAGEESSSGQRPPGGHPAAALPLPRILAIANQKGGVGKTTTAVNLSAALAELGYRVLVVDLDPQGNATTGLGINARNLEHSVYDVLLHDVAIDECIEPTTLKNLFVAPATIDLAGAEIELVPAFSRELKLRRALADIEGEFDFTVIDCPPSLGLLTVNGLAAATEVVVPIQCEYYALEGLGQLLRNVGLVQGNLNPRLVISAVVLTMYDARTRLSEQVGDEVRTHFGAKVCRNIVPRTVRLSEAPSFGQPIIVFDPSSRGALAYRELAKEVSGGAPQRVG